MEIIHFYADPLFLLAIGILVVVGGIIGLRLHAFLALLFGAFVVALLTPDSAIIGYVMGKGGSIVDGQNLASQNVGHRIATYLAKPVARLGF